MNITLPRFKIGDNQPTYIIAEVGSNWVTFQDVYESVKKAKQVGADAVKFQMFDKKDLFGLDMAEVVSIQPIWLETLRNECDNQGIDLLCTGFSPDRYDMIDPFVDMHKIASAEATHVRILQKVNSLGKPVMLSTGAKYPHEIEQALTYLKDVPVIVCYCAASYPAKDIDLRRIDVYRKRFKTLMGYSDHSIDIRIIPTAATRDHKACVLEKHVSFINADTPDKPHSLNFGEFKAMVSAVRGTETLELVPTKEEAPFITNHNRRLIAIKDIKEGDKFEEGINYDTCRSTKPEHHAYSGFMVHFLQNKNARTDIYKGCGIGPGDV